ncbi:glycosyltransferase [Synechocystis sp. LEGE 06083]|uniref:glycosyltransferase n=1 Tax=Synechocystis sp. LEGE 06083 TaxID=915336 RepID=UPI001881877A|nr:glycosyltransferase family 4 protein [Synechocystis sp. LEGE 06083]MBE9194455.1 glycosyltransferase [Synechocystis sp. LEGE 06083]
MKKVLIISPVHTHPVYAGNSERIYRFMLALRKIGCEVCFLHLPFSQLFGKYDESTMQKNWGEDYISFPYNYPRTVFEVGLWVVFNRFVRRLASLLQLRYRPIFLIDEWYDNRVNQFLQKLNNEKRFDTVIVEYVFFSKALENFDSSTIKIIDTHDVFTDRHKLLISNQQSPSFFYTNSFNENKGLNRADKVIAIQKNEQIFFKNTLGLNNKIYTISHFPELEYIFNSDVENNIAYFSSSNPINLKSFSNFLKTIFPSIKDKIANVNLLVGGSICDHLEENQSYKKLGKIDDKKDFYKKATVVINPMLFGTGIKIKTVESLGYGMPLVTTSAGADGLEDKVNKAFLVADNSEEFAQNVIKILLEKKFRLDLSQMAFQFAEEINSANISNLKSLLEIND